MNLCLFVAALSGSVGAVPAGAPALPAIARIAIPSAEIPAYDPQTNCVFVAAGPVVAMVHLGGGDDARLVRTLEITPAAGFPAGVEGEVSHVAVDPRGRGFFAATVIPSERGSLPGRVVFVSTRSARVLGAVWVGFQPDGCDFTADGNKLVVANEGEPLLVPGDPVAVADPPGAITVIDLAAIASDADLAKLEQRAATTFFVGGPDVDPSRARIHPYNARTAGLDLEPESIAINGSLAYVSFQENNAIGVFDLAASCWRRLEPLAPLTRVLDASDKDGGIHVESTVDTLPLPDQLAFAHVLSPDGSARAVLLVANEGDDRGDVFDGSSPLADKARVGELRAHGRIADSVPAALDRLQIDAFRGDDDGDGRIEHPYALGSRSLSIHDATTLERIGDTGSSFELAIADACPAQFNADGKSESSKPDARSDDSGPEPEGVRAYECGGKAFAVVTLERPGAIAIVDVSDPAAPRVAAMTCTAGDGDTAPEGLCVIPAERSPTGAALLVVAFEHSGTLVVYRLPPPDGLRD